MEGKTKDQIIENVPEGSNVSSEPVKRRGGVFNKLYPPGEKGGAGPRLKNHCRKFWWCDLLVLAVIVLVIVLPLIYVGIPNIAQKELNKSTLEVTQQDVLNPKPDQIDLKLVSLARSDSKYHPTLDPFTAALYLDGQEPFLYVEVPKAKTDKETKIVIEKTLKFASLDRFSAYNQVVMGSESFKVNMKGKTKLHMSGLPAMDVDYKKVVTMKGLNKLSGLNITEIHVQLTPNDDGSNMVGNVFIPNPSVMTLQLGNVTMDLSVDGQPIGQSLLPDLVLKPGDNNVPMRSTVNQGKVLSLIASKYKNAILPLEIVGNSSMVGDQHLTYYESAIRHNVIKLDLNVGPALKALGLNL